jgi:cell division protein FtsW
MRFSATRLVSSIRRLRHARPLTALPAGGEFDLAMFGAAAALLSVGTMVVFSATVHMGPGGSEDVMHTGALLRHLIAIAVGGLLFYAAVHASANVIRWTARWMVWLAVPLLLAVWLPGMGKEELGSARWINLGFMTIQPSEVAKVGVALYLARYLANRKSVLKDWKIGLLPGAGVLAVIMVLLLIQPDVGSVFLIAMLAVLMVLVGGTRLRYIAWLALAGVGGLALIFVFNSVKFARLVGWLYPNLTFLGVGHHPHFAMRLATAGGPFGYGLGEGPGHSLGFLTQSSTDFIFTVLNEELGFVGVVCVVLLYMVIAIRGFALVRRCQDDFVRFAAFALTLLLILPALVHMMVDLGMIPTKGIACPFLSFGGTSMLMTLGSLGLLQRIHLEVTAQEASRGMPRAITEDGE